jgi:hypothetical protein
MEIDMFIKSSKVCKLTLEQVKYWGLVHFNSQPLCQSSHVGKLHIVDLGPQNLLIQTHPLYLV